MLTLTYVKLILLPNYRQKSGKRILNKVPNKYLKMYIRTNYINIIPIILELLIYNNKKYQYLNYFLLLLNVSYNYANDMTSMEMTLINS